IELKSKNSASKEMKAVSRIVDEVLRNLDLMAPDEKKMPSDYIMIEPEKTANYRVTLVKGYVSAAGIMDSQCAQAEVFPVQKKDCEAKWANKTQCEAVSMLTQFSKELTSKTQKKSQQLRIAPGTDSAR
ncbi:MAG: hypothetical protein H7061_03810, partial [Bdellovibrionaceae bacterium]|nr:hypothetical protein [Bdellovibrio sp.]